MCNVYGVEVPGMDGRAGMAAIVLENPSAFDGQQFYELVSKSLPGYAAPAFVRIQEEPEMTGTFKLRKVDLQREGYDPEAVKDPLYVRDDSARAYLPLTGERLAALRSGELRV
jgi:fatty-acyl-CoA synthase